MMRQQVNLYTREFRLHEQPLSSRTLLWSVAILLLVLAVWDTGSFLRLLKTGTAVAELQETEHQLSTRLAALGASRPVSNRGGLEREVAALRADIQRRQELQSLITQQNLGNIRGFSPLMTGMARQAQEDIWLTQIRFLEGGRYLEMAGWTRRASRVPFYLQQLRNEEGFAETRFGVLGIRGREEGQPYLQFTLLKNEDETW